MKNRPVPLAVLPYCCYSFTDAQLKVLLDEDTLGRAVNEGQSTSSQNKVAGAAPQTTSMETLA